MDDHVHAARQDVDRAARRLDAARVAYDAAPDDAHATEVREARADHERALRVLREALEPVDDGLESLGGDDALGAEDAPVTVAIRMRMENLPTSLAHVLARRGTPLVSVDLHNPGSAPVRVSVSCWIESISARAVATRELGPDARTSVDLFPPLLPGRARRIRELTIGSVHVHVRDSDGRILHHDTRAIPMLACSTALMMDVDPSTGDLIEHYPLLAAWVTPNAPEVLRYLRVAATQLGGMIGYQSDGGAVTEQVRAIYDTLKAAEIRYVSTTQAFGSMGYQQLQRVRLPRESLAHRSANCIDGTVLMASLLEACGLYPVIVVVPGHAFLGWRAAADGEEMAFVETTLIGKESFDDARAVATRLHAKAARVGDLTEVDVAIVRRAGITPME